MEARPQHGLARLLVGQHLPEELAHDRAGQEIDEQPSQARPRRWALVGDVVVAVGTPEGVAELRRLIRP